jgi:manganese transport protein
MCRDEFPRPVVWMMWVVSETVAIATDLAEFLGAALGFYLLLGIPLFTAALLTAAVTFAILALQRFGHRPIEIVITILVGIIAACYLIETLLETPAWGTILRSAVTPRFNGSESLVLAVGILGATVMPHVIFLHSSLTQDRIRPTTDKQARLLFRYTIIDVVIAMGIAGLINGAMLIMAASTFHSAGHADVGSIEVAYQTLTPLLGPLAGTVFAVSLLASGVSSSTVGTMAGQVIMQGFLHWHIPMWVRRTVTMLPALVIIALKFDPTRTLVISQVVLSFGIPFALIPLVMFTTRKDLMGTLVNRKLTTIVAAFVALIIVGLNLYLLFDMFQGVVS